MKWKTLKHNGVLLPPEHEFRHLSVQVKGITLSLSPFQEEMAWAWVKKRNTPYIHDEVFQANFITDFQRQFQGLEDIQIGQLDFSEIIDVQEAERVRNSDPERKKELALGRKKRRELLKEKYGYAEIDGVRTEVGNYLVEPPGIFMGRGEHPLRGKWKPRVLPEDIILNLDETAVPPPSPIEGKQWGKIIHDHDSTWLASWHDNLSESMKYVWLSDVAAIRQNRDKLKYETAASLRKAIKKVRSNILKGMQDQDQKVRKVATVAFLIDNLSMRVGDEKDEEEADTVGASTLRVEHLAFSSSGLEFDFLGKDSVRWQKSMQLDPNGIVVNNLKQFVNGKRPEDQIFENIASDSVNRFLAKGMKGLSAKVFRTYQASNEVRDYLKGHEIASDDSDNLKIFHAKMANLQAATRCNHKRTPPENWSERLVKKEQKLTEILTQKAKTEKGTQRLARRAESIRLKIKLDRETKDYNLNTSLRNYIDPRLYKGWAEHVDVEWAKLYPKALQRKFAWVDSTRAKWP
jgi:DNA topoisomerase-1